MIEQISVTDIKEISFEIWSTMAGTDLAVCEDDYVVNKSEGYVVASVQIVGAMQHVVRLDMCMSLVKHAASSLLMVPEEELTTDDVRDAAGELANMMGGGVKALLPAGSSLTIPSVVSGTDYEFTVPHGDRIVEYCFESEWGGMKICIMERRPS